jgi:hypothetical protein
MRSMAEGFFGRLENPSTALRAVPLPRKIRGRSCGATIKSAAG